MKIECPNCKLVGNLNEGEVPLDGRYIDCPRCKTGFHVKKPAGKGFNPNLMSSCPACQYSTFTDETFEICPKCGMKGSEYNERKKKQKERDQEIRDLERINKSLVPDDFVKPPTKSIEDEAPTIPPLISQTAYAIIAIAFIIMGYGVFGVVNYKPAELLARTNETSFVQVTNTQIFLRHGIFPYTLSIYGLLMFFFGVQFLRMKAHALKGVENLSWLGLMIGIAYEVTDFMAYYKRATDTPTGMYIATGVLSSLLMLVVWVSVPMALVWWMRNRRITREFAKK